MNSKNKSYRNFLAVPVITFTFVCIAGIISWMIQDDPPVTLIFNVNSSTMVQYSIQNNVWGNIGWGDIHCALYNRKVPVNYDKAEEIYRLGLTNCYTEINVINERLDDLENKRNS